MPSCRKKGGKKGKSLLCRIVSESTETVRFVPKRFFRKIMSFWFSAKESDSRYNSWCLSIQSSPVDSLLNAFETSQQTLGATCKLTQQFTMLLHGAKSLTGFSLCATTYNRVCKRTQHVTSNSIVSCWPTMLRPFASVFYGSKLFCEKKAQIM